jgi:hypothetical protein
MKNKMAVVKNQSFSSRMKTQGNSARATQLDTKDVPMNRVGKGAAKGKGKR